jgi:hypothetical protein
LKGGPCRPLFVVFTGEHDDYDLLLEAVGYLAPRSRVMKYVIIHAASWGDFSWVANREALLPSAPELPS